MATVPELLQRIYDLEMERAGARFRYEAADRALLDANDELREAIILAARDPEQTRMIAALQTGPEWEAAS